MIDFLFGVGVGICVMLVIDGRRAVMEQKRAREKINEELDKMFKDR